MYIYIYIYLYIYIYMYIYVYTCEYMYIHIYPTAVGGVVGGGAGVGFTRRGLTRQKRVLPTAPYTARLLA